MTKKDKPCFYFHHTLYIFNFTATCSFSLYLWIIGKSLLLVTMKVCKLIIPLFKGLSQSEKHFIGTFISRFTNRKV